MRRFKGFISSVAIVHHETKTLSCHNVCVLVVLSTQTVQECGSSSCTLLSNCSTKSSVEFLRAFICHYLKLALILLSALMENSWKFLCLLGFVEVGWQGANEPLTFEKASELIMIAMFPPQHVEYCLKMFYS